MNCGVTILKPLKGLDGPVESNLESFFHLDHTNYELIFSVAEPLDPVVPVVQKLQLKYPSIQAKLIIAEITIGPNPKINNLIRGYNEAKYELILISDSNIRVDNNYLNDLLIQFPQDIAMLSSVVAGTHAENLVGKVESVFLNTVYARSMVLSNFIGIPCMMGKSLLFRKSIMEKLGGLSILSPYLAEDYMAGKLFHEAGYHVSMSRTPVTQYIGKPLFKASWSRHVRWGRIRKAHALPLFLIELSIMNALLSGFIGSFAIAKLQLFNPYYFFSLHVILWLFADCLLIWKMEGRLQWVTPILCLVQELLSFPLWLHIASSNKIIWKGRKWSLKRDGTLE